MYAYIDLRSYIVISFGGREAFAHMKPITNCLLISGLLALSFSAMKIHEIPCTPWILYK